MTTTDGNSAQTLIVKLTTKFTEIFALDVRSLALLRIGLGTIVISDFVIRAQALTAHYSDAGILPRTTLIQQVLHPWNWSIHLISGQPLIQGILFAIAIGLALCLLVGYRTRWAAIAIWALVISVHNRNPALIFASDHVLRALLFWAMFLPLGAAYSIDRALNSSSKFLPTAVTSGGTIGFMIQLCFIYIWSATYKLKSELWWPDGDAVYYSLKFDQYVAPFGQWLLHLPPEILKLITYSTLIFEWLGPLLILVPFRNSFFRCLAIIAFVLLHFGFGLSFYIGILSPLSIVMWLALIPTGMWDHLARRASTQPRRSLQIYYDHNCTFCRKVVCLLRTFLVLPDSSMFPAQEHAAIYAQMEKYNSWVIVDWQNHQHFKWEGLIYVVSLSPILGWLAPTLRWRPLRNIGNKIYEIIAANRTMAGHFTAPLLYRPLVIQPSWLLNGVAVVLLMLTSLWNLRTFVRQTYHFRNERQDDWISVAYDFFNKKKIQQMDWLSRVTKLDQSWSIFAPSPPRDDGWYVITGEQRDGTQVNVWSEGQPIRQEKPTIQERNEFYQTAQWRAYFIALNRGSGKRYYPSLANYLCHRWNRTHRQAKQIKHLKIDFIDERTVPPGQLQTVTQETKWQGSCSSDSSSKS